MVLSSVDINLERAMLVNFCLENFKSFKGMAEFTMIASENPKGPVSERLCYDEDRLIHAGDPEYRLLPVSAIFGANSYGKSTFVESLLLIQKLVLEPAGTGEEILVSPFFIDPDSKTLPTSFELNLISEGQEYEIYIKLDKSRIIEERVSMVKGESVENMYHRKGGLAVAESLDRDGKIKSALESSCADNALLLSNPMAHEIKELRPIYNWFSETLLVVPSGAKFIYVNDPDALSSQIGEAISRLDTGAVAIQMDPAALDSASLKPGEVDDLRRNLESKEAAYFMTAENDMFMARMEEGEISLREINIVKQDSEKNEFSVSLRKESNGTHRLLHLLPAILHLGTVDQSKVVVIDDFDRNLHDSMTRSLVEYHLSGLDDGADSQFIFTAHDINLIDNYTFRNDEVWIIHKDYDGASEMICMAQFEENEEGMGLEQLRKAHGFSATPRISLLSSHQINGQMRELAGEGVEKHRRHRGLVA